MKRSLSFLLVLLLLIASVPISASVTAAGELTLNKTSVVIGIGEFFELKVTSTGSSFKFSSSNKSIATVSSSGKITAKAKGTAAVTVKGSNGKTATCKVTVKKAPSSVSLNKTSITMGVGETYSLSSKVSSGAASYKRTYTSSNPAVAVRSGSYLTAKSAGTATITVKTYNGKTATCKVTVKKAPSSVSLNKTSITMGVGETYSLSSKVSSGAASYKRTYTSSNPAVAVRSGSYLTAKSAGTATITVKTYNGKTATCKVTVKKAPSSVSLNKTSITMGVGETYSLSSKVSSGAASYKRTYTSSNPAVAVRSGSYLTAKSAGTATITVKTYNGKTATCKVTVKKAPVSIKLNKTSVILNIGDTVKLSSTVNSGAASNRRVYKSSNSAVASVKSGLVTALSGGKATITVTAYNGITANCDIYIPSSTKYVKGTSLRIYEKPKSEGGVRLPYMTPLLYIGNYSTSQNGTWDMYEYNQKVYYMWTAAGASSKVTDTKSSFTYSGATKYEDEVIAETLRILDKKTQYIHGTTGQLVSGTTDTYSYDCSGFASSVLDKVMGKYIPVYNISANLQTLFYQQDALYNGGTDAAFYATDVIAKGEKLDISKLRAGDLIFFWLDEETNEDNYNEESSHVGLYLGNGEFIHCSNSFNKVLIMPLTGIYSKGFVKASRMLPEKVQKVNATMYTKGNLVAFRSSMKGTDDSNLIQRLPIETEVTVEFISSTQNWAFVNINGAKGYIALSNLTKTPPASAADIRAYAVEFTTRLYFEAVAGSDYIEIPCATEVILKKQKAGTGYYWVEYNGKDYYVYLNSKDIEEFFTTDLEILLAGKGEATVSSTTNFRSAPSSADNSNVIESVKAGTRVTVIAVSSSNTWSYVRIGKTYGYIITKSLN